MDTIVACSTPPGTSGLAVLRLSGPACRTVAAACLGRPDPLPRHVYHGPFRVPSTGSGSHSLAVVPGEILDRLNFVFFSAPASATGEDVLEIYPHGNPLLIGRILAVLSSIAGVRPAAPGEFTRRAFEQGKIDLLQAEAVGQLIHAETVEALRNARRVAEGALSAPLKALREGLVDLSVRLELDVDFSEEEADPDYGSWVPRLEAMRRRLDDLAAGFEKGRGLGRAPRVAILGAPNAGKSSLVNALVREDRLMVSAVPGTTRDWVEVTLTLPGGRVQLVDTAGLGRPVDDLDAMAMERTRRQWGEADVRVWVEDGTREAVPAPLPGMESIGGEAAEAPARNAVDLRVRTKADLPGFHPLPDALSVSSPTGDGLEALRTRLEAAAFRGRGTGEDPLLTTERQFRAVMAARDRVDAGLASLRRKPAIEILAFEIREAAGHLRELLGEIAPDEVLGRIFAGFCIGK
ncbi:MAG: tRNA modification GTPase [Fibrobacteres bacterium]|nr:tRNA modification GTPase [Fibrobacterota bacterium]